MRGGQTNSYHSKLWGEEWKCMVPRLCLLSTKQTGSLSHRVVARSYSRELKLKAWAWLHHTTSNIIPVNDPLLQTAGCVNKQLFTIFGITCRLPQSSQKVCHCRKSAVEADALESSRNKMVLLPVAASPVTSPERSSDCSLLPRMLEQG